MRPAPAWQIARVEVSPRLQSLSIAGRRIVYAVGKAIDSVDAATGTKSVLGKAAAVPIGLSIEGRRVAWAENIHGHSRIRAVTLLRSQ